MVGTLMVWEDLAVALGSLYLHLFPCYRKRAGLLLCGKLGKSAATPGSQSNSQTRASIVHRHRAGLVEIEWDLLISGKTKTLRLWTSWTISPCGLKANANGWNQRISLFIKASALGGYYSAWIKGVISLRSCKGHEKTILTNKKRQLFQLIL